MIKNQRNSGVSLIESLVCIVIIGIGFIGMILNLFSATLVASLTAKTPADVKEMVDNIRQP